MVPVLSVLILAATPAEAQQHRAVRLGHPNTRFAPPLNQPDQLRALFRDPKLAPDVVSILRQAGWTGEVSDLTRAAATAPIREMKLPRGSRLPFMSSRENGRPVALMDVLWDGNEPIEAYAFDFVSKGRRVRCITPRPCSNFYVVDLGPVPPAIGAAKHLPAVGSTCEPFDVRIYVTNSGLSRLTSVAVLETLPDGWTSSDGKTSLLLDLGTLEPGQAKEAIYQARAAVAGRHTVPSVVTTAEGVRAEARSDILVKAPHLLMECEAPAQIFLERPTDLRLRVRNSGEFVEARTVVLLSIPPETSVISSNPESIALPGQLKWELGALEPGAIRDLLVQFRSSATGTASFEAAAVGACATTASTRCETKVLGIPAILLEVIDLDDPIEVGKPVTYEIRVTNQGTLADRDVRVDCALEEAQTFVSGSGPTAVKADGFAIQMEPLPELKPKEVATWKVTCTAAAASDVRFKVSLTSSNATRPIQETEATRQY